MKIHLITPFLGKECYIGSNAKPITLNLTTGTTTPPRPNKPISGHIGEFTLGDELQVADIAENTLVDNTFLAPGATGCGAVYSLLIDPIIDAKIGLPSAAGKNTIILNNTLKEGTTAGVIVSEK